MLCGSAAAQQVLELCKELHVYGAQLPQHKERISHILNAALESYISRYLIHLSSPTIDAHRQKCGITNSMHITT